ncbi:hypothetical protein LVJ94_42255 [Pendulispora rubella]|uniref:Uncharacterized protein n=1 Tax=Pendulispora rubella TaxID=2741070 RepID=A0ABZ2KY62_9BACT
MAITVQLDDESSRVAVEVDHVRSNGVLPAPLRTETFGAQVTEEDAFRHCPMTAELAGEGHREDFGR